MKMYHSNYRVLDFLEDYNIDYKERGKNIGRDSINITCFRCDDKSYHLGIHKDFGIFHCWRCGYSGNFKTLVKDLLCTSYSKAAVITSKYCVDGDVSVETNVSDVKSIDYYTFYDYPKYLKKHRDYALKYLTLRYCPHDYLLKCGFVVTNNSFGVYLPIYYNHKLVSWQIRYIKHKNLRYKSCPGIILNKYLFFYDDACIKLTKDTTLCLVEGVFDVFTVRCIHPTVGLFGSEISKEQILLLKKLMFDKLYIIVDGDDTKSKMKAENIFFSLPFVKNKYIIELPEGEDPNSLGPNRMKEILRDYDSY